MSGQAFRARFGRSPSVLASAPARVNLIGEHLDYNGGCVLPASLPLVVDVACAAADGAASQVHSAQFAETVELVPGTGPSGRWSDHAAGAIESARCAGWLRSGVQLSISSSVPPGAGLSSSAAVICGVLRAVAQLRAVSPSVVELARMAQAVERDFVGVPCGLMDQMAILAAPVGHALLLDTATLACRTIALPAPGSFVVVHSGVRRQLSEGRYAERRAECEAAAAALGVAQLCGLPMSALVDPRLSATLARRARHVLAEHARVGSAANALHAGDLATFGRLMTESHASMRDDFEVSVPPVDALVADAIELGALGARLTGGGFGGCVVALLGDRDRERWASALCARHPHARVLATL